METIVVSRIMNSLNTRRKQLGENEKGFTLIELLVVVIIIGILAAIAIPVYLGIQNNAKDSATKSDLTNLKTGVVAAQTTANGALPANQTAAAIGTTTDSSTAVKYTSDGSTVFCISALSGSGTSFRITESSAVKAGPAC